MVKDLVYEPLLVPGESGELSPRLARTWQRFPNGNLYVELDTSRRFSDGSPVTLQDVADSLTAAGLRTSPRDSGLEIAPGADRLWPELALPRTPVFKKVEAGFLGTGAFVVVSQDRDRILLQRSARARHRIDRVELVAYQTEGDVLTAVKRGECNGALGIQPRTAEFATYVSQLQSVPIPPVHRLAVVLNRKVFSPKERRILLPHLQASDLKNVDPDLRHPPVANSDPDSSRPLAAGLGSLGSGPRLNVVTWNGDWMSHRLALAVRLLLDTRGGEVTELSPPEAAAALVEGRFEIFVIPIRTWPDAEGLALWRSGGPLAATGYSNAALDGALDAGDWKTARQAFDLDPPGLFPMEWRTMALLDPRIVNPTFGRYLRLETLPSWEVR